MTEVRGGRPARPAIPGIVLLLAAVLAPAASAPLAAAAVSAPSAGPPYAGRRLSEVLRELGEGGPPLVFTDELVRPELHVLAEPVPGPPRSVLEQVLAPHGLALEEGPGGVLVVVAAADGSIQGSGADRGSRQPLPGAVERVVVEDEIVVRPSRLSLLAERPVSAFALGREQIESLPQLGGDLFRAASLLPGVTANDVTARFSVRGGRRDEVKVVLDGQELFGAYHLLDYDGALSLVPAEALGEADLITGAQPASEGDRMSAVLDLTTLEPPSGRHLAIGVGVFDLSASGSGRFAGERGGWLVTARRGSLDLAADAIGDEDPSFWDILGKVELDAAGGTVRGHVLAAADELEVDRTEDEDFERLENDYGHLYGWVGHRASPGRRLLIDSLASWARLDADRAGDGTDEEGGHFLRDRRDLEVVTLAQSFALEAGARHLARFGWEARRYEAELDYAKALEQDLVIVAPFSPPRRTEHAFAGSLRGEHLGLWASDRLSLGGRATAEVGLRWDRHDLTGDTLLSPRLSLARRIGERHVVRAAWGRFHQSQRPYELQVEDGLETLAPAERSDQWVLGWETLPEANPAGIDAVRVELYQRDVANPRPRFESLLEPLNFFPEIEPDRIEIVPERARARGAELLVAGSAGERVGWRLAYTLARAEDRLAGEWVPRSLDQRHTLAGALHLRLPRRWTVDLAWRFHSGWPATPVEAVFVLDEDDPGAEPELTAAFGPLNSRRLPAYHRLDLRVSRRWTLRTGRLTFYADVQNLYDRENPAGFDVELDEEAGEVVLEPEGWPGIFPSLGVTYEF